MDDNNIWTAGKENPRDYANVSRDNQARETSQELIKLRNATIRTLYFTLNVPKKELCREFGLTHNEINEVLDK